MFELIKNNNRLNSTFDNIFNSMFNEFYTPSNNINYIDSYYSSDDKNHYIELALPGINKKDINLSSNDGYIYLSYDSSDKEHSSMWNQSFNRRIKLPKDVLIEDICAKLKDGILSISIKKDKAIIKSKTIEIK